MKRRTIDRLILSCAAMQNGDTTSALAHLELATKEPDYESTLDYLDKLQTDVEDEEEEQKETESSILEQKGGCNNV